jgi:hypothetical protein
MVKDGFVYQCTKFWHKDLYIPSFDSDPAQLLWLFTCFINIFIAGEMYATIFFTTLQDNRMLICHTSCSLCGEMVMSCREWTGLLVARIYCINIFVKGGKVARVRRYLYTCPLDYAKWATHYGLHPYKIVLGCKIPHELNALKWKATGRRRERYFCWWKFLFLF